jgi:hypothetical protein
LRRALEKRWPFEARNCGEESPMCPACMAALAMVIAGTTSTGGLAAILVNKFRAKAGAKETIVVRKVKETETKENAS